VIKRGMDLVAAAAGLLALAPLLAVTALAVRVTLGRPVLFRQRRPGWRARPFTLYKFRTMREATSPDGEPLPDEARLTRLGRFFRSTSLDELPTLWNVLKGDMSLVGPRPLLMEYLPLYSPRQMRRHEVRPGITGWAQVSGRNAVTWERKFELDVWYVDNRSLRLDLLILARTLAGVLRRQGISQPGHATAEKFRGAGGAGGSDG
jgi:sugar transferase EpsL